MSEEMTFYEAKKRLSAAIAENADAVKIDRETAAILAKSYAPDPEPDLKKYAIFNAALVPFLRPVVDAREFMPEKYNGITVEPCEAGGVTVSATNGSVAVSAHDPDGHASGMIRFTASQHFFDACVPPPEFKLQWEGEFCEIEGSVPDFAIPGLVHVNGICLLVMPKSQPEGTDENDGGALFSMGVSTGNTINKDDYRIYDGIDLAAKLRRITIPADSAQEIGVTPGPLGIVAQSMASVQGGYWHMRQYDKMTVWLNDTRPDLFIQLAACRTEESAPKIPAWLGATL